MMAGPDSARAAGRGSARAAGSDRVGGASGLPGIVVFSVDYKPRTGGIAEHAHRVALGFHKVGVPVTVLAPGMPGSEAFDRAQPFKTIRVPRIPVLDWLLYASEILSSVRSGRAGLVYCATSHPCGLICVMLKAIASFSFTVTIHAHEAMYSSVNLRQRVKKALKRAQLGVFSRARMVYAVSCFTRNALLEAGVKPDRVTVIYNGVAVEDLLEAPASEGIVAELGLQGKRMLLTVGRLIPIKGQDIIIRAMPEILRQVPEAVLVIVGDGVMKPRLVELASEVGMANRVVFAGEPARPDVIALFRACDVCLLNSRQEEGNAEGFGIVLLEAAVFGKPTVGGRSGGIPDAMEDGVTGILVDPLKPEEVAGAAVRILQDPDLAARLGEAGHARAISEFTWDGVIERVLSALSA